MSHNQDEFEQCYPWCNYCEMLDGWFAIDGDYMAKHGIHETRAVWARILDVNPNDAVDFEHNTIEEEPA